MEVATDATLVLIAGLAGGVVARLLRQPLLVGYVLAGVVVGPFTGGFTVAQVHGLEQIAELGAVLLLFSLGLEVSFRDLTPVRTVAVAGGALQLALTMAFGAGLGHLLGWTWLAAAWFGAAVALSSTMVALKTLQNQGRIGTLSSRVMLGVLVVQDLAVVPLMIVLPRLGSSGGGLLEVVFASARAFALLAVIVVAATRIVPPLMRVVARWNSRELFLLATTALALGIGYAAWRAGLSLALGAFVAGLVVNESDYAHQALSDIVPLRDLFGMLFFVSVGMLIDPAFLWRELALVGSVAAAVTVVKALVLAGVALVFGYRRIVPLAMGLTLFQVGEFAFVLARVGRSSGGVDADLYALVLAVAVLTMALTPAVSGLAPVIYRRFASAPRRESLETINFPASGVSDHVIVAGAGRVGRTVGEALSRAGRPCVLVELDYRRVESAREGGLTLVYGDAAQPAVLEAAGLAHARAVVLTVPTFVDAHGILQAVRGLRPEVAVIARADGAEAVRTLQSLGIREVASPEFEAAIELTRLALVHLNLLPIDILQVTSGIRRERYLAGPPERAAVADLPVRALTRAVELAWITIPSNSPFDGRTLAEIAVRSTFGVSVVAIQRGHSLTANPGGDVRLNSGDSLAVVGTREQSARLMAAAEPADV